VSVSKCAVRCAYRPHAWPVASCPVPNVQCRNAFFVAFTLACARLTGIGDRFVRLFKANVNELLNKAEDPQKMLDQIVEDMQARALCPLVLHLRLAALHTCSTNQTQIINACMTHIHTPLTVVKQ